MILLAEIEHEAGSAGTARGLCEEALQEEGLGRAVQARAHATASLVAYDDFEASSVHAARALALLNDSPEPDPTVTCLALQGIINADLVLGRGFRRHDADRAVSLEPRCSIARVADRPSAALGAWLGWVDDLDAARVAIEATVRAAVDEGDDSSLPFALSHLPLLELRAGNWDRALEVAEELLELSEATGQEFQRGQALYVFGNVVAHRGDFDLARTALDESLAVAVKAEDEWAERTASMSLGFVELAQGDPAAARLRLERSDDIRRRLVIRDVGQRREVILLIDALVELGDLEVARRLCDEIEHDARALDRPAWRAKAARGRALILAAGGDIDGAAAAVAEALEQHTRLTFPFDLGQTLLLKGQIERRRRQKTAVRDAFTQALSLFDGLGARPWADRTRAELARSSSGPANPDALTPTERRVAELAGSGLTNREVAAALFVSAKTVEANLARVYRKLNIRSRAELGRAMADTPPTAS